MAITDMETTGIRERTDGPPAALPGNLMIWILIVSELAAFGAAFLGFSVARAFDPAGFAAGQAGLDGTLGAVNTMVLVTSGYLAARAVAAGRRGAPSQARLALAAAALLAAVFLAVKAVEYAHLIGAGLTIDSGGFHTLYFLLTGFHALHVAAGMVILPLVGFSGRETLVDNLETGAAFWHMVDLVWVLLYPLVYLIR
ncbi:cytochrome c oxidase subunit 3 [Azospirillum picis]|uniref:Nitric oxide reductase NorE protein n=1 Tax=Azospirillum picis TaxID=488438 RepID=A0ABU0MLM1_9PROT|nr:cytochrome c oxidase subunit 3 [Azospirillum picis]MBP2301010.1 nitric oxide reductase NorE protein [Azospirillum picis]MDQ0534370.1 nitric oxide reductase NorE protein [Azospirillum picis]